MNNCLSALNAGASTLQWAAMLQSCGVMKALFRGHCIHHHMVETALDYNTLLCNSLLDMYGKCGAFADADASFMHIHHPNVISWNFVIKAFAGNGRAKRALQLYNQMQEEGFMPSKFIFVTILSSCMGRDMLQAGKRMHVCTIGASVYSDVVVRTALVHMYSKCGSLDNASIVFQEISYKDTLFYNAIILAHAQHGSDICVFYLVAEMLQAELTLNKPTFLSLISLCSKQQALIEGKLIHSCIAHSEYERHTDLGTALVNMYGKCSSVVDACGVFDNLSEQDSAAWNSVISVCVHNEIDEHAFFLFNQMQVRGVVVDVITLVGMLSACARQGHSYRGIQIDVQMRVLRLEENLILRNTLLNMYCNCGTLHQGTRTFDNMPTRDAFSWNAFMSGCMEWKKSQYAFQVFHQMLQEGMAPDGVTFVNVFSMCGELGALATGLKVHALLRSTSYKEDVIVATALVNMYGKCSSAENAEMVFCGMLACNIFSWNAMMAAYCRKGDTDKIFQLLEKMLLEGIFADKVTFCSIFSSSLSEQGIAGVKRLHTQSIADGLDTDVAVSNALINAYSKCGVVRHAVEVFEKIKSRDLVSWNALITAYVHNKLFHDAFRCLDLMAWEGIVADNMTLSIVVSACSSIEKGRQLHTQILTSHLGLDASIGNALINMYSKCEHMEGALKAFSYMHEHNSVTYLSVLSVCGGQAALEEGKLIHAAVVEHGLEHGNIIGNALLNVYGKCSSLDDAQILFENLPHRDMISYNILIAAYSQMGHVQNAFSLLRQMQLTGFMPDKATFVSILSACSHGGLIEEGLHFLKSMKQQFDLTPSTTHYNCMIDLLGRAGLTNAAETLVRKMPVEASVVSWMALLGAFRNQVDAEGAERAAKGLWRLDAKKTAPYVVMSNTYAGQLDSAVGY